MAFTQALVGAVNPRLAQYTNAGLLALTILLLNYAIVARASGHHHGRVLHTQFDRNFISYHDRRRERFRISNPCPLRLPGIIS